MAPVCAQLCDEFFLGDDYNSKGKACAALALAARRHHETLLHSFFFFHVQYIVF